MGECDAACKPNAGGRQRLAHVAQQEQIRRRHAIGVRCDDPFLCDFQGDAEASPGTNARLFVPLAGQKLRVTWKELSPLVGIQTARKDAPPALYTRQTSARIAQEVEAAVQLPQDRRNVLRQIAGVRDRIGKDNGPFLDKLNGNDVLFFFVDPLTPMPHDVDVKALMRLAIVYDIPMALNRATAEHLLDFAAD